MKPLRSAVVAATFLALALPSAVASADETGTPTPSPTGSAPRSPGVTTPAPSTSTASATSTSARSTGTPSATTRATPSTATSSRPSTVSPSPSPTTASPSVTVQRQLVQQSTVEEAAAESVTLKITAGGTPQPGKFFSDIGYFDISGTVSSGKAGERVEIYWYRVASKEWRRSLVLTTTDGGAFSGRQLVGHWELGLRFRATLGGNPAASEVVSSNEVKVDVRISYVRLNPIANVDALKSRRVTGYVYPARPGVSIHIDLKGADGYRLLMRATTDAAGTFSATFTQGTGELRSYRLRSGYVATNRGGDVVSPSRSFRRVAALNAVVTRTTAAEVAKTYRSGCPVGPSKLSTITMNYYGMSDQRMHRGVLIIRSSLTDEVIRGFAQALAHRYPVRKMNNPNVYGGNDPVQMEANNTSGFNCRKVVGNPYAQSPHSYGIAIDVNTVQNPYRDVNGRWWPKNGRSYVDRSPRRYGMLVYDSYLTRQLRKDDFFWGGLWSPGRDYQHFQYDR